MSLKDPEKRKEYHRNYIKKRMEEPEYKAAHYKRVRKNDAKYKDQNKQMIDDFRANGCSLCPEAEPCCLSAHHLNPVEKDFSIGDALRRKISPIRVKEELAKCICLCENCHRKVHAGILTL